MFRQCAFLTMQDLNGYFCYDHLTIEPLNDLKWSVTSIPWNEAHVDWNQFEVVVVRSPWDYQLNPVPFVEVLTEIEASDARLLNSLTICRWNMNKTYLRDLSQRRVPLIPTRWLDRLDQATLPGLFAEFGCEKIVIKPTIGAGAVDTFVLHAANSESWQSSFAAFAQKPLMAQPFVESVITEGEYSLFYFGGEFSHAIIKQPKPNDFRVQEEHGGIISSIQADERLLQVGQSVLDAIDEPLLYARVDLVRWQGELVLIELELIEPSLYFSYDEPSPNRFAMALDRMMATTKGA